MRETLAVEVESFLRVHGATTATAIAVGVRARRDDVDEVLKADTFGRVPAPDGCSPHAHYFNLSYLVPSRAPATVSRADRMLSVLRDRRPHSRQEIFEATGSFFLTNNAASELRGKGFIVEQRRERGVVVYQLVGVEHAGDAEEGTSGRALPSCAGLSPDPDSGVLSLDLDGDEAA